MRKHAISAAHLLAPMAAIALVAGLAACGDDDYRPTVTKTETTRTTTTPGYIAPTTTVTTPTTTGTTTTQTTVQPAQ